MESQYIVAIVSGSLFLVLILVYIILRVIRNKKEIKAQARLFKIYNDDSLAKMEYDFAAYDEDTTEFLGEQAKPEEKSSADNETNTSQEEVFVKVESEGMEEITGNYKPE